MDLEDILIQLFLAALYFGGVFVAASVVLSPDGALQAGLLGLIASMLGYLMLRAVGHHRRGPILGAFISLGFAILTFGLIWWVARIVLEGAGLWPFKNTTDR